MFGRHFGALRNLRLLHLARFEVHDSDLSQGSIWFTSEDIVYLCGEGNTNTSAVVGDTLDAIGNLTYVLKRLLVGHTIVFTHPSRSNVWNLAAPAPSTPGRPGPPRATSQVSSRVRTSGRPGRRTPPYRIRTFQVRMTHNLLEMCRVELSRCGSGNTLKSLIKYRNK
jgi:hypothetical protein